MPALKHGCCCCCSLKTGVANVAIYSLIFNLVVIVVAIYKVSSIEMKIIFISLLTKTCWSDTLSSFILLNEFNDGRPCWCNSAISNDT